jgi:hypothetical protein
MQERLKDVMHIIEDKNPALINEICKGPFHSYGVKGKFSSEIYKGGGNIE